MNMNTAVEPRVCAPLRAPRVAEQRSEGSHGPRSTDWGVGMAARRAATPEGLVLTDVNTVFRRRYAARAGLGRGSVDSKSTATITHRYAVPELG